MHYSKEFKDYELLDMANGEKLEKWGEYTLIRPDPQIVWDTKTHSNLWSNADARYIRSNTGGGSWQSLTTNIKKSWKIKYRALTFNVRPMGFKHTGLFPEQAVNWDYLIEKITQRTNSLKTVNVLNLFAYTGGATIACAYAKACVCHVDSSQGMTNWAKDNLISSNLKDANVRFIVDDVIKFVQREIRRGTKYDCIIMDPPSYGRGKNGEVWSIEKDIFNLLQLCSKLLSKEPLLVLINTYTGGLSGTIISNIAKMAFEKNKVLNVLTDEIGIKQKDDDIVLPCGITTICEF
ncbi:MAG: class I SAM-dependent methyltransferase [Clostridia bacterium]